MSFFCKKCSQTFADWSAFRLHYRDAYREVSYDANLQEVKSEHYLNCLKDGVLGLYFERDESKVYHLKEGAALRIKADRAYITKEDLGSILTKLYIRADEVIKQLPDVNIRGNRYSPQGIEKTKALETARKIWFEA